MAKRMGVTYNDVKLTYDPVAAPANTRDLGEPLLELVRAAVKHQHNGFLLLLDEAQAVRDDRDRQGEHPLSLRISAVSSLQREEVPLGLVLCGLPTLTGDEAAAAFTEPLRSTSLDATPDLVDAVVKDVEGDIDFYEPRLATLTPAEQDLLLGSTSCDYPPLDTTQLKDAIDKSPGNINVLLGRLVEAGVLYRLRKG